MYKTAQPENSPNRWPISHWAGEGWGCAEEDGPAGACCGAPETGAGALLAVRALHPARRPAHRHRQRKNAKRARKKCVCRIETLLLKHGNGIAAFYFTT